MFVEDSEISADGEKSEIDCSLKWLLYGSGGRDLVPNQNMSQGSIRWLHVIQGANEDVAE